MYAKSDVNKTWQVLLLHSRPVERSFEPVEVDTQIPIKHIHGIKPMHGKCTGLQDITHDIDLRTQSVLNLRLLNTLAAK